MGKRVIAVVRIMLNVAGASFLVASGTINMIIGGSLLGASLILYIAGYGIDRSALISTTRESADKAHEDISAAGEDEGMIAQVVDEVFETSTTSRLTWLIAHFSVVNFVFDRPGSSGCGPRFLHALILLTNLIAGFALAVMILIDEPLQKAWGCYWGFIARDAPLGALEFGTCDANEGGVAPVCNAGLAYPPGSPYHVYNVPGAGVTLPGCKLVPASQHMLEGPRNAAIYILLVSLGLYVGVLAERANDLDFLAATEVLRMGK